MADSERIGLAFLGDKETSRRAELLGQGQCKTGDWMTRSSRRSRASETNETKVKFTSSHSAPSCAHKTQQSPSKSTR